MNTVNNATESSSLRLMRQLLLHAITIGCCAAVAFIVVVIYLATCTDAKPSKVPITFDELSSEKQPAKHLAEVEVNGETKYVWVGAVGRFSIASGGPCYVFDSMGVLEKWVAETGEGGSLDEIAQRAWKQQPLAAEDIKARIRLRLNSVSREP